MQESNYAMPSEVYAAVLIPIVRAQEDSLVGSNK